VCVCVCVSVCVVYVNVSPQVKHTVNEDVLCDIFFKTCISF